MRWCFLILTLYKNNDLQICDLIWTPGAQHLPPKLIPYLASSLLVISTRITLSTTTTMNHCRLLFPRGPPSPQILAFDVGESAFRILPMWLPYKIISIPFGHQDWLEHKYTLSDTTLELPASNKSLNLLESPRHAMSNEYQSALAGSASIEPVMMIVGQHSFVKLSAPFALASYPRGQAVTSAFSYLIPFSLNYFLSFLLPLLPAFTSKAIWPHYIP